MSLDRLFLKLKSTQSSLATKTDAIETLLSYLVDRDTKTLISMYETDQVLPLIINYFLETHISQVPQEGAALLPHSEQFRCLEVSLDFLEFLITQLPEALVNRIEEFLKWLLKLKAGQKGGEVLLNKVHDLISIGKETLSADVMLPNLVAVITADVLTPSKTSSTQRRPSSSSGSTLNPQLSYKLTSLETMRILIEDCQNLTEDTHFESLV